MFTLQVVRLKQYNIKRVEKYFCMSKVECYHFTAKRPIILSKWMPQTAIPIVYYLYLLMHWLNMRTHTLVYMVHQPGCGRVTEPRLSEV